MVVVVVVVVVVGGGSSSSSRSGISSAAVVLHGHDSGVFFGVSFAGFPLPPSSSLYTGKRAPIYIYIYVCMYVCMHACMYALCIHIQYSMHRRLL